jgi:uncharacterized damage-inducible protein DinB
VARSRNGATMVAHMIAHEAHHRGQVSMLAGQLGFRLSGATTAAMWGWERIDTERSQYLVSIF